MRNAILQLPDHRNYMRLDERAAQRSLRQLRADVDGLKRHLAALRAGTGS